MQWLLGPLLEVYTIHKIPFDKIFKKLPTTNCKNNAAFLYGISILKVKKIYTWTWNKTIIPSFISP